MRKATEYSAAYLHLETLSKKGGGSLRRPLRSAFAQAYQQAGAPSWVTAAFGAFAMTPVKTPQFFGLLVTAGLVIVAFQPAAFT